MTVSMTIFRVWNGRVRKRKWHKPTESPCRKVRIFFVFLKNFFILRNIRHASAVCLRRVKKIQVFMKEITVSSVYYSVDDEKTAPSKKNEKKLKIF